MATLRVKARGELTETIMLGPLAAGEQPYPEPAAPPPAPLEEPPLDAPQEEPPGAPFNDGGRTIDAGMALLISNPFTGDAVVV
jgi:hypothetical protein